jgi:hypothetical protein|tara:strand:- start:669 stop:1214 length:546 start_codon:yes stop_codon:yes gene_type:complete
MFSTAIPGQSLTSEPKNSRWENPPRMVDPEESLLWHLEKLQKPKSMEAAAGMMALGIDILTLTEGVLRAAVAEGEHSIDVSLIIAPVIHEYIKGIGDAAGVDYKEGFEDDEEEIDLEQVNMSLRKKEAMEILADIKGGEDIDLSGLEDSESNENMSEEKPQVEMPEPQEEKPMGLMSRRVA